jgi:putative oxidoreductase
MQDIGKLVLRLTVAGLILFHGIHKLVYGIGFLEGALGRLHVPSFLAYGVYIGEVAAPLFVILGLWPRIAALFIVFNMVVAIGLEAWRLAPTLNRAGGWGMELEAFYLLGALAIFFLGSGRWALRPSKGD